jgi:uncharacterized protein YheU (UPF0270 family)
MAEQTAKQMIEALDAIEADQRSLETRVKRVRHALQRRYGVDMWDYDGRTDRLKREDERVPR